MPSPSSFAAFALVNAIVWPAFALAYWSKYQRSEERLLDAISQDEVEEESSVQTSKEVPAGGES